jgi:hypothetical protein
MKGNMFYIIQARILQLPELGIGITFIQILIRLSYVKKCTHHNIFA